MTVIVVCLVALLAMFLFAAVIGLVRGFRRGMSSWRRFETGEEMIPRGATSRTEGSEVVGTTPNGSEYDRQEPSKNHVTD